MTFDLQPEPEDEIPGQGLERGEGVSGLDGRGGSREGGEGLSPEAVPVMLSQALGGGACCVPALTGCSLTSGYLGFPPRPFDPGVPFWYLVAF